MAAMSILDWSFDLILGVFLLWLAWQVQAARDLFEAVVLFVTFGLVMALVWVRLDAPDVAMAEAAIGAGLTGALLLASLSRLRGTSAGVVDACHVHSGALAAICRFISIAIIFTFLLAMSKVLSSPSLYEPGLREAVVSNLGASGVGNPVTAVLLNFRGYDTLLELAVLMVAYVAARAIGRQQPPDGEPASEALDVLTRLLVPILIMVAAYLLWVGADGPGGAFQAGSVLGAAGVLLVLSGWRIGGYLPTMPARLIQATGLVAFLIVAVVSLLRGGHLLEFVPSEAAIIILFLEACATFAIGTTLAGLFLAAISTEQDRK